MYIRNWFAPLIKKFRLIMRNRMMPITEYEAEERREILSRLYLIFSVVAFGMATYITFENKLDLRDSDNALLYSTFGGEDKTRVIHIKGLTKTADYTYSNQKDQGRIPVGNNGLTLDSENIDDIKV